MHWTVQGLRSPVLEDGLRDGKEEFLGRRLPQVHKHRGRSSHTDEGIEESARSRRIQLNEVDKQPSSSPGGDTAARPIEEGQGEEYRYTGGREGLGGLLAHGGGSLGIQDTEYEQTPYQERAPEYVKLNL